MALTVSPETSLRNYQYSLRNNPDESSSHPLRRGSLTSRSPLLDECCFSNGTPGLNFRCAPYNIFGHGIQTAEIFHLLRLPSAYYNLQCGRKALPSFFPHSLRTQPAAPSNFNQSINPAHSTVPFLPSSTSHLHISQYPILKSPNPSTAQSIRCHLHLCLNPLPSSHFSLPLGTVVLPPSDPGTICLSSRCQFLLRSAVIWSSPHGQILAASL